MKSTMTCPECGAEFEMTNGDDILSTGLMNDRSYLLMPKCTDTISEDNMRLFLNNIEHAYMSNGTLVIPCDRNEHLDPFDEFDAKHVKITTPNINATELDDIEKTILNDGYIPNTQLWRRWIMAQMLRHYKDSNGNSNFNKYFVSGKPYIYQWKTILDEIKTLKKLSGKDLTDRERFFNIDVIKSAAQNYVTRISKYIRCKAKKHGRNHIYIKLYYNNANHRIYLQNNITISNEIDTTFTEFMKYVNSFVEKIQSCKNYNELQTAVDKFIKHCPTKVPIAKAPSWKNAFKGAGAYYTMDNMIKFHNCNFFVENKAISTYESLQMLENKTIEYKTEYYKLYALMQNFIDDNKFKLEDILKANPS